MGLLRFWWCPFQVAFKGYPRDVLGPELKVDVAVRVVGIEDLSCSLWRSARERLMSQLAHNLPTFSEIDFNSGSTNKLGTLRICLLPSSALMRPEEHKDAGPMPSSEQLC